MNRKKIIITATVILVSIIGFVIYKILTRYEITLKLKAEEIKVNLYDTVDVMKYLDKAYDNKGNDLLNDVFVVATYDTIDFLNGSELSICGNGAKIITYTIEKNGLLIEKNLIIKVIIDPNDKDYNKDVLINKNCPVIDGDPGESD